MIKSIQQFQTKGIENLEKVMGNYSEDMTRIAEMVHGVTDGVVNLGLSIIAEELEAYDEWLRKSAKRKQTWYIVKRDKSSLLTSLGSVTYQKTLFQNKNTGEREYLLDRVMGLEKHARMTEDAEAKILEEAVESSYRKGGENASIGAEYVSKQTVMNKIHSLKFPKAKALSQKKTVSYLYIDGDEDHVSLQYLENRGDIGNRRRVNTIMPKIVYVYEGITNENGRNELVNVKYFGGIYAGREGNQALWKEVWDYIECSYDVESLKQVYVNGDGAAWIKSGAKGIAKGTFVLDKFHMHKYIIGATTHLLDSAEDARGEIYRAIYKQKRWMLVGAFDRILHVTENENKRKTVETAKGYLLENWYGIMEQVKNKDVQLECSAEGHVSHVYADRMSSRPLGWSRIGVDQMSRLRTYYYNKGNMLELVRYQKNVGQEAAGAEGELYLRQILKGERMHREALGVYANMHVYSIPYPHIKKIANFREHIWGL
ncbi:MAG: ISLre2 family transposase [Lachnospiraceae bacterium]